MRDLGAGGGSALLSSAKAVDALIETLDGDEKVGAQIIRKAIEAPIRQIAYNAGIDGSIVLDKILSADDKTYGFDALKFEYVNMFDAGITDPTKVIRTSLQNAASIAALFLTTEASVAELPKQEAPVAAPAGGMGMM